MTREEVRYLLQRRVDLLRGDYNSPDCPPEAKSELQARLVEATWIRDAIMDVWTRAESGAWAFTPTAADIARGVAAGLQGMPTSFYDKLYRR